MSKVAVVEPSGIHWFEILGSNAKWRKFVADAVTPEYVGAGHSSQTADPDSTAPRPVPRPSRKAVRRG